MSMDRDLTKLAAVTEAHYADLMGGRMKRFHDKYANAGDDLFVNFNPKISDPRDKTIFGAHGRKLGAAMQASAVGKTPEGATFHRLEVSPVHRRPDHSDPTGIYAYPASYVAKHWNDIDYGRGAGTNLRIMRLVAPPEKVLTLSGMKADQFFEAFARLKMEFNVHDLGTMVSWKRHDAARIYEAVSEFLITRQGAHHRVSNYSKVLWFIIQQKFTLIQNHVPDPEGDGDEEDMEQEELPDDGYEGMLRVDPEIGKGTTRSQVDQTSILLKGGYEAVLDRSGTSLEATIFKDEPEQILFLTKRAFEVVEVVKMSEERGGDGGSTDFVGSNPKAMRALMGTVAKQFNDRLTQEIPRSILDHPAFQDLQTVRYYIATGDATGVKPLGQHFQYGFITAKGRLILANIYQGPSSEIVDKDAKNRETLTASLSDKVLYRPWDFMKSEDPSDALRAHVHGLNKLHRWQSEFDRMVPKVFMVAETNRPLQAGDDPKARFDDIAQDLAQQFKMNAKTMPWHGVTLQELKRYVEAANSHAKQSKFFTTTPDPVSPAKNQPQKTTTATNAQTVG